MGLKGSPEQSQGLTAHGHIASEPHGAHRSLTAAASDEFRIWRMQSPDSPSVVLAQPPSQKVEALHGAQILQRACSWQHLNLFPWQTC